MGRKPQVEIVAEEIVHYFEDNKMPATAKEIEAAVGASQATTWRAIQSLADRGALQSTNPNRARNMRWQLIGSVSKMPMFKDDEGRPLPISTMWKSIYSAASREVKFSPYNPRQLAMVAATRFFYAAILCSKGDNENARGALGAARRNLHRARHLAKMDLDMIDRMLADPKLNPNNPRQLIPILLEDEKNFVDVVKMWEEAQVIIKWVGNQA